MMVLETSMLQFAVDTLALYHLHREIRAFFTKLITHQDSGLGRQNILHLFYNLEQSRGGTERPQLTPHYM